MKIIPLLIERLGKSMIGGVVFESAKRIVLILEDSPNFSALPYMPEKDQKLTSYTGAQKKQMAIEELVKIGYALTSFGLSAVVELAWMWMQAKSGKPIFKSEE